MAIKNPGLLFDMLQSILTVNARLPWTPCEACSLPPSLASLVATVAVESIDPEAFARDYFPGSFRDPQ